MDIKFFKNIDGEIGEEIELEITCLVKKLEFYICY
jgi:hypothetical protein